MSYLLEVVRQTEQFTTSWSGGTTTQIAIYPHKAKYSKRDFTWRLSSARVEGEESTFTSLPGFSRVLMSLDGEIRLVHQGHHSAILKPFEQDRFYGEWTTKSFGKARDFNLMMSQHCNGNLAAITFGEKESLNADIVHTECSNPGTTAFYCVDGSVQFVVEAENAYEIQAGDALLLDRENHNQKIALRITNLENEKVHVIRANIQYLGR